MSEPEYTHSDLIENAKTWLENSGGCKLVITEPGHFCLRERVDAIGWSFPVISYHKGEYESTVIECKTSLSDFYSNNSKEHIKNGGGAGLYRYFLAPPDLAQDLVGRVRGTKWGVLRPWGKGCKVLIPAHKRDLKVEHARDEMAIMYSALRWHVGGQDACAR